MEPGQYETALHTSIAIYRFIIALCDLLFRGANHGPFPATIDLALGLALILLFFLLQLEVACFPIGVKLRAWFLDPDPR